GREKPAARRRHAPQPAGRRPHGRGLFAGHREGADRAHAPLSFRCGTFPSGTIGLEPPCHRCFAGISRIEEVAMPRLFTALEIPRDASLSLSLLRGGLPGARWIDTENYHITLRFIGDVEGHVADEVANALDRVRRPSFNLTLSGVGAFGSKKPHSVYAAVVPSPELSALQGEIE